MASTNKTENYSLNQWVKTDPVLMADMNADNARIDAALKALDTGMAKLVTGSYVGTGEDGSAAAPAYTVTTDFEPKFVLITGGYYLAVLISPDTGGYLQYLPNLYATSFNVAWGSNSVSWYNSITREDGNMSMNREGTVYRYLVIGQ